MKTICQATFDSTPYGRTPVDWRDLVNYRPAPNWAVDGRGLLRVMMKEYVGEPTDGDRLIRRTYLEQFGMRHFLGMLVYTGANGAEPLAPTDASLTTTVRKTPDPNVVAGVVLRVRDRDHYYAARFRGDCELEIVKFGDAKPTRLVVTVASRRYREDEPWTIEFAAFGDRLTAKLFDAGGGQVARCDALDGEYRQGGVGLTATTFAAFENVAIRGASAGPIADLPEAAAETNEYPIVKPVDDPTKFEASFEKLAERYDVVVAGGGTGGFGAALQAARLGASVLLLEETDLLGGQMANAGVTSMDEGGQWGKNSVRERGIYREFHESAVAHYYTINKDPFTAYHYNRQSEGGFEPQVARRILYGLIAETKSRRLAGDKPTVLDVCVRTKVVAVKKQGDTVTGATLEEWTVKGPRRREVVCGVLIDATEYGDLLPLAGARYRVGTSTSDTIDPNSPLQEHTWLGVIREYPEGIPEHLRIKQPPPGYADVVKRFSHYGTAGKSLPGKLHKNLPAGEKPIRLYVDYVDWRGMPDAAAPATGELTERRHTRCGLNGGNDYPVTAATCEDAAQRRKDELWGIHRTLGIIYWFQHELGVPWAQVEDEGYATPYNLAQMKARGVRDDLLPLAALLPQLPYARESRRMIGVETLRGSDIYVRDAEDQRCRPWASGVAINEYSIDLHGTRDALEADLDEPDYVNATGPFQVPFGAFIPESIDGFLPAEKNFSQSRLVNGATRLQPSTMLNGQAVGTIAALAVRQGKQPRELNVIAVQAALLDSGVTLIPRWYDDVPWNTPLWRATQLLSLYGMLDRPGPLKKSAPLGVGNTWGANEQADPIEATNAVRRLATLCREADLQVEVRLGTRAELALILAEQLKTRGSYRVGDPSLDNLTVHEANIARLKLIQKKKADKQQAQAKAAKQKDSP